MPKMKIYTLYTMKNPGAYSNCLSDFNPGSLTGKRRVYAGMRNKLNTEFLIIFIIKKLEKLGKY